jgi:hypothetical protein
MSFPMQPILRKSFVSSGAATSFALPNNAVKVQLFDLSNAATTAAQVAAGGAVTALYQYSFGLLGMSSGSGYSFSTVASGAPPAVVQESVLGTDGYTFFNSSLLTPGAAIATTGVTAANPAVVSTANTSGLLPLNSIVRMINVTNMQQISSIDFTVGSIVANTSFQLAYMNTTGFVAGGAGFYRILPFDPIYYPRRRTITGISQAPQAVITMSVAHGYTVGQQVRISVPAAFGMTQMDGLLVTILAVTTGATNTITVNVDSSAFSAFAFPSSAVAATGVTFAEVTPVGEAATAPFQNLLDDATRNTAQIGVTCGSSVIGAAGHNMLLIASAGLVY